VDFGPNKFNQYPYAFQQAQNDPLLDTFFEATQRSRASQKHQVTDNGGRAGYRAAVVAERAA